MLAFGNSSMDRQPHTPKLASLRTTGNIGRPPSLRISISSSPARQSPQIIPSPTSPAKSISGAIMEGSHSTLFNTTSKPQRSRSLPKLPEVERDPPLPHLQSQYHAITLPPPDEHGQPDFEHHTADFFDSDSSELEASEHDDQWGRNQCKSAFTASSCQIS